MCKRQLLQDDIEKECESNRVCIKKTFDQDQRQQEQARKQMTREVQMMASA